MGEQLSDDELVEEVTGYMPIHYPISQTQIVARKSRATEVIALIRANTRVEVTEEQVEKLAIIKFCGTANSEMWRKLPAERRDSYRVKARIELRAAGIKVKERNV